MIKEVIVVEGKDDISIVKRSVDAEIISTNGFGYNKRFVNDLKQIAKRQGLIIFTDPDFAGEQIRRDLDRQIPNCKHAFLAQDKSIKKDDIGIENAKVEDIIEAINRARPVKEEKSNNFTKNDLLEYGLVGDVDSRRRRDELGHILGIGYGNGKQFLSRLNNFNVTKEEFLKALERIN